MALNSGQWILDGSGRRILRTDGKTQLANGSDGGDTCNCACGGSSCPCPGTDCTYCASGKTAIRWKCDFSGVSLPTTCFACSSAGGIKCTGGARVSGGTFSGSFTLLQTAGNACRWEYQSPAGFTDVEVTLYSDGSCSSVNFVNNALLIRLEKTSLTTYRLQAILAGGDFEVYLYDDTVTVASGACCASFTSTNDYTNWTCEDASTFETPSNIQAAKDGSASLTPCSTGTCDDCLTDSQLSDACATSYSVTLSGFPTSDTCKGISVSDLNGSHILSYDSGNARWKKTGTGYEIHLYCLSPDVHQLRWRITVYGTGTPPSNIIVQYQYDLSSSCCPPAHDYPLIDQPAWDCTDYSGTTAAVS